MSGSERKGASSGKTELLRAVVRESRIQALEENNSGERLIKVCWNLFCFVLL